MPAPHVTESLKLPQVSSLKMGDSVTDIKQIGVKDTEKTQVQDCEKASGSQAPEPDLDIQKLPDHNSPEL